MIPYPFGFDDNKVFKEQLDIVTFVQVCRIILLTTNKEKLEDFVSKDQTMTLKITSKDSGSDGRSWL